MPVEMATMSTHTSLRSHRDSGDDVVGLGVPQSESDGSRVFATQEEDDLMSAMIMKHRSDLQRFVERTMPLVGSTVGVDVGESSDRHNEDDHHDVGNSSGHENLQNILPSPTGETAPASFDAEYASAQPRRNSAGERLHQLSRTERTDRMKLAELSDVRNEKLGRDAIMRWNPKAQLRTRDRDNHTFVDANGGRRNATPSTRERALTTPQRTTAKMLGKYTKDFVQQALDFNNPDLVGDDDDDDDDDHTDAAAAEEEEEDEDDEDLLSPPSPSSLQELLDRQPRGRRPTKKVQKYMKHMQTTIAQLSHQRDELMRNQAEFDKHASGIFPSLETLNNQLSQLVQERMLQSQINLKDDLDGDLRALRVRLNELEAEAKSRRNDAELHEQRRALDIAQIKGEIASLGTTGSLQNQKLELLSSQVKRLQQETLEAIDVNQSLSKQYQLIDTRITALKVHLKEVRPVSTATGVSPRAMIIWLSAVAAVVAVIVTFVFVDGCSGVYGRCHPLT